ncbi:preprotein translocase subunit SecG [Catalinimonas alkaloidigena]|uniref:preprotein translocase subunit SecG n=1 Tax=Catalinimonas alkaloidigena TaxID=1075417 RepID=UPI0024064380|nr:preprotein translocase subunit SecG [Catalinimonas alkaloidigena]MDF9797535.1 preprotein translocase subunit SecG [Catalinimonas alkaloidigena]
MFTFIISLALVAAVLLILVVLSQNSKGGGLSSQFGGAGSSNQMIGVKRTTDLLEKLTWGLAIGLIILSLSSSFLIDTQASENGSISPNIDRAQDRSVLPNMNTDVPAGDEDSTSTLDLEDLSEEDVNP